MRMAWLTLIDGVWKVVPNRIENDLIGHDCVIPKDFDFETKIDTTKITWKVRNTSYPNWRNLNPVIVHIE